jgi:uncharacterized protein with NRDE domain
MCLIAVAWRSHPRFPLIIAANRDEFHARPTRAVHRWDTPQGLVAGRDLEAGGTWLGASPTGRIAAITNVRQPDPAPARPRSRGELPVAFLAGRQSPEAFITALAERAGAYRGFNLLVADREALYLTSNLTASAIPLAHGIHAISNAPIGVDWPKTRRARERLGAALADGRSGQDVLITAAFGLLADATPAPDAQLPVTGPVAERERALSAIFIAGPEYGTRCSSVVLLGDDGALQWHERRFGPGGEPDGETRFTLDPEG